MTYNETIQYLYEHLPMYQRIGAAAYKKDLTNTLGLLAHLGHPERNFKTIHVAGTNGKGTVSHLLAGMYATEGLRVGLYTSPHYIDFRERMKVNGQPISKRYLQNWVAKHRSFIEWLQPSFFEMTVAMAFDYFSAQKVDVAVIEVGLGGRLDSTNVVSPLLSVITNISWDHMNMLGNTLPQIAAEKAGIIKPNTPVLIGEHQPEVAHVFEHKAKSKHAPLFWAKDLCDVAMKKTDVLHQWLDVSLHSSQQKLNDVPFYTAAEYQHLNIKTALAATEVLAMKHADVLPSISLKTIKTVFANLPSITGIMGRWQVLQSQPLVIGDSAHNESGLGMAMQQLQKIPKKHLHFVLGVVNDKDLTKLFQQLPKENTTYYFCKANIPRGLSAAELAQKALEAGFQGKTYTSVKKAYNIAKKNAQADDCVYVGGSIFTLAEVL